MLFTMEQQQSWHLRNGPNARKHLENTQLVAAVLKETRVCMLCCIPE